MNKFDPNTLSESDRKQYEAGMAIVKKKLAACHKPTAAELHAASIKEGQRQVISKFGSVAAERLFGIPSASFVPSPEERLNAAAERGAAAAIRAFNAKPSAKRASPAKAASKPLAKAPVKTAGQKYFGKTVHKFYAGNLCS